MENLLFKLELDVTCPIPRTRTKYFKSLKTLRQWKNRNDVDNNITIFEAREYILVGSRYERFHIFFNKVVPLSELITVTTGLIKSEESKSSYLQK